MKTRHLSRYDSRPAARRGPTQALLVCALEPTSSPGICSRSKHITSRGWGGLERGSKDQREPESHLSSIWACPLAVTPGNLRRACTKFRAGEESMGGIHKKSAMPAKHGERNSILHPALALKFWTWAGGCYFRSATVLRRQEGQFLPLLL